MSWGAHELQLEMGKALLCTESVESVHLDEDEDEDDLKTDCLPFWFGALKRCRLNPPDLYVEQNGFLSSDWDKSSTQK